MDPIVQAAIAATLGTVIAAAIGWRATRRVEQSKSDAVESTHAMQVVNTAFDGLQQLSDALRQDNARLEMVVKSQRTEIDSLNAELRAVRRETRPSHLRTRHDD